MRTVAPFAVLISLPVSLAAAQIASTSVDILDASDPGGPAPAGMVVLDFFVDLPSTDAWIASGIRCTTMNGATIAYADGDDNTPGLQPTVTNTGSSNSRFVTLLSRPLGRNAAARFDNSGASIPGRYDPTGPDETLLSTELNAAFYADPLTGPDDDGVDGYVVRIALQIDPFFVPDLHLRTTPGFTATFAVIEGFQDGTPLGGWVNATHDDPTPVGGNYYLVWRPEPTTGLMLLVGIPILLRRR